MLLRLPSLVHMWETSGLHQLVTSFLWVVTPPPPGRDGEPALLSAPPAPLEGSPQVIREGRPLGSRPMGRRQDVDDECARRLYLRPWRRKEAQE